MTTWSQLFFFYRKQNTDDLAWEKVIQKSFVDELEASKRIAKQRRSSLTAPQPPVILAQDTSAPTPAVLPPTKSSNVASPLAAPSGSGSGSMHNNITLIRSGWSHLIHQVLLPPQPITEPPALTLVRFNILKDLMQRPPKVLILLTRSLSFLSLFCYY